MLQVGQLAGVAVRARAVAVAQLRVDRRRRAPGRHGPGPRAAHMPLAVPEQLAAALRILVRVGLPRPDDLRPDAAPSHVPRLAVPRRHVRRRHAPGRRGLEPRAPLPHVPPLRAGRLRVIGDASWSDASEEGAASSRRWPPRQKMPDQLTELVPAPLDAPVPSRGADVASTWAAQGSHSSLPRYKLCFAMCWTTPSGTRYHTGRPAFTRLRQSVEEIAIAGISTSETPLFGKP